MAGIWRIVWLFILAGIQSAFRVQAADTTVYRDPETGFTFTQYSALYEITPTKQYIIYRIAVPSPVTPNSPYDAVVQIVAPSRVGWAGMTWGGRMIYSPITMAWPSGSNVIVSSRYTTSHTYPQPYRGATYQVFKNGHGTHVNSTHWQITAKCSGCTAFQAQLSNVVLKASGSNNLAWAYSASRPNNPSSNTSTFSEHDAYNYWSHDFASAGNTAFNSLVSTNVG